MAKVILTKAKIKELLYKVANLEMNVEYYHVAIKRDQEIIKEVYGILEGALGDGA